MPIDDRTTNRSYQLPNAGNQLVDDVARLRAALQAIDADVFARYTKTETDQKIADLIQGAPGALDTLNELAAAMGDDPNFATTITNALAGKPLDRQAVFRLCAELEGHPDNAAPGAFGGFCIAPKSGPLQRYPVGEELAFVLLIPDMELETSKARGVLPAKIALSDAALSVGNAAAIAGAFASGDYRKLAGCFEDRLHQPYRAKLMPFLDDVIAAGCSAGALGGWLSGAGSTIACAALRRPDKVANAMIAACGLESACAVVVRADNAGVKIA